MLKELEHTTHRFITHYVVLIGMVAVTGIVLWWLVSTLMGLAVLACAGIAGLWFLVDQLSFEPQLRLPLARRVAKTVAWVGMLLGGCLLALWCLAYLSGYQSPMLSLSMFLLLGIGLTGVATIHAITRWTERFSR